MAKGLKYAGSDELCELYIKTINVNSTINVLLYYIIFIKYYNEGWVQQCSYVFINVLFMKV